MAIKVGRNNDCPCLSGRKYKNCCDRNVDWEKILRSDTDWRRFLSVRGRNIYFSEAIGSALDLDNLTSNAAYKAAFTPQAVRKIHEAAMEAWPRNLDIAQALKRDEDEVSGLYIGDYSPEYLTRGIVRHSIYANKILVVDPFVYASSVRDEYNPILNPDQYRAQTLKNVNLYLSLLPWVYAGIIEIIRTPADFDPKLNWETMKEETAKFENNPTLKLAIEQTTEEMLGRHKGDMQHKHLLLGSPDSYLHKIFKETGSSGSGISFEQFLNYINKLRDEDIDFLEPMGPTNRSQLHMMTTGAIMKPQRSQQI